MTEEQPVPGVDVTVANVARMYDYLLGGKDNFAADRAAAEKGLQLVPDGRAVMRANHTFLRRSVRYLVDQGVRQFLDIGTGLPTQGHVHELVPPDARVVYVDYDPVVVRHAEALLGESDTTAVVTGDLRRPHELLTAPAVLKLIDFSRPVGVLLVAILHFITDEEDPEGIVAALRDALPSGSHLVISHGTAESRPETMAKIERVYDRATAPFITRGRDRILRFFDGFELVDPGVVPVTDWRPDAPEHPVSIVLAGVGRLP